MPPDWQPVCAHCSTRDRSSCRVISLPPLRLRKLPACALLTPRLEKKEETVLSWAGIRWPNCGVICEFGKVVKIRYFIPLLNFSRWQMLQLMSSSLKKRDSTTVYGYCDSRQIFMFCCLKLWSYCTDFHQNFTRCRVISAAINPCIYNTMLHFVSKCQSKEWRWSILTSAKRRQS